MHVPASRPFCNFVSKGILQSSAVKPLMVGGKATKHFNKKVQDRAMLRARVESSRNNAQSRSKYQTWWPCRKGRDGTTSTGKHERVLYNRLAGALAFFSPRDGTEDRKKVRSCGVVHYVLLPALGAGFLCARALSPKQAACSQIRTGRKLG